MRIDHRRLQELDNAFVEIDRLISVQDYPSAVQILCEQRSSIKRSGNSNTISRFLYLQARCHYHMGDYSRARILTRGALRLSKTLNDHSIYASQKQLFGLILLISGEGSEAVEEFLEAYAFRRRACEYENLYGCMVNIGMAHLQSGALSAAKGAMEHALSCADRYNTSTERIICLFNLARICAFAGDFSSSRNVLNQARTIAASDFHRARLFEIEAISQTMLMGYELAQASFEKSQSLFSAEKTKRDVAVCLEYLGLNEYFAGNYAKAREYYYQVLAMPEPTASAVAQTLRMLTDVEIAEGNWDAAKATAARADAAINEISERIELGALWRAYGHIHTHDHDYAKAREYFEKSIDLLRQLGARYELALSHFDAGYSSAYSQEEQIEHLKAAKALFVEMEVPKRVAQVDEALGRITSQRSSSTDKTKRSLTFKSAPAAPVVVAVSRSMTGIMELVDQIKNNDMTVLITGETGTGKDLLAEYIHYTGNRCGNPFKAINCAAMPESLLELELFGVKKGTFTGSTTDKPGLIESADGGTFYFDEIGDAPAAIQSKLLRVIETKTVRRLGSNEDVRVNVRFIAATNQNLQERIASREFRRDLYYRLAEVEIALPPLRDRQEDVMPLISQFLKAEKVELTTEQYLQLDLRVNGYDWPGNVREVRRLVKLATATTTNGELIPALESALDLLNDSGIPQTKAALIELLARHNGNISSVARELGIPRTTLISHLKKFGLQLLTK